jgi:hypothetical protein
MELQKTHTDIQQIKKSEQLANVTSFMKLLNVPPKKNVIKQNKFANNSNYLSIGHIEHLLDSFFPEWSYEVKSTQVLGNSIAVTVSLTLTSPITGNIIKRDGVGACPIELKSGTQNALDFGNISPKAIQKNLPTAKSLALKNAAQTIADIFGRNINREDDIYIPIYDTDNKFTNVLEGVNLKNIKELYKEVQTLLTNEENDLIKRVIEGAEETNYKKAYKLLISKK